MKKYLGLIMLCSIFCMAADTHRKHVEQQRYYEKQLPYAMDGKQVVIIQNPQQDKHVHTIKRTQKTIYALEEQRRLQAKFNLKK